MRYVKYSFGAILLFSLVIIMPSIYAKTTQITGVRYSVATDKTRLVFDVSGPISYSVTTSGGRIKVILKNAKFIATINPQIFRTVPLANLQRHRIKNDLCLIMDLRLPSIIVKHFSLFKPSRLIFDFYNPTPPTDVAKTTNNADKIGQLENRIAEQLSNQDSAMDAATNGVVLNRLGNSAENNLRSVIVVIDPGHGGKDSGAIGQRGTYEKDINLAMAKTLKKIINNTRGFRAVLTRDSDYYIPLRERLAIAHNRKADMFVSLHADAYKNRTAHGVSIFALSQRGATSEAAHWLAEKENESELGQVIADKDPVLRSVLIDLAQSATVSASLEIGGRILHSLTNFATLHASEVEQAAFVVLKSPDIPSLLIEVGFISYRPEEARLRDWRYQRTISGCIALGIEAYFMRHPPPGSYLARIKSQHSKSSPALIDTLSS